MTVIHNHIHWSLTNLNFWVCPYHGENVLRPCPPPPSRSRQKYPHCVTQPHNIVIQMKEWSVSGAGVADPDLRKHQRERNRSRHVQDWSRHTHIITQQCANVGPAHVTLSRHWYSIGFLVSAGVWCQPPHIPLSHTTRRWPSAGLLLAHRLRRWANNKPTLDLVCTGICVYGTNEGIK